MYKSTMLEQGVSEVEAARLEGFKQGLATRDRQLRDGALPDGILKTDQPSGPPFLFKLLVSWAQRHSLPNAGIEPHPGDLVVETTSGRFDPDALGFLISHDEATYAEDNTGPKRDVWDIIPLRGFTDPQQAARGYQRWENASFRTVVRNPAMYILKQAAALIDQAYSAEFDNPCRFDHHGYCQEHGHFSGDTCAVPRAKEWMDYWTEKWWRGSWPDA